MSSALPGRVQVSLARRLASDVFDSNGLWFYAYKRARRLAELGYASVAVGAFGRVIRVAWPDACSSPR